MIEALCTGNLIPNKHFESAVFGPFSCVASSTGMHLDELDTALIFKWYQDNEELSAKEKVVTYDDNLIITTSLSQPIKILNIFTGIVKGCMWENALLSLFTIGWQSFALEKEDHITNITRMDMNLPDKIQSFLAQTVSDYCSYAHFEIPENVMLNCSMATRDTHQEEYPQPPTSCRHQRTSPPHAHQDVE